jgi:tetratricopeptide (TPR) repeat protein
VGWLWFLGTLVPVLGIMQSGNWPAIADRFTYLPSVGISIMVAWGIAKLFRKWRYAKIGTAISASVVLITLLICTRIQVRYWKDDLTLYERALEVTEDNFLMLNNYGVELGKIGKLDLALDNINEARRLKPNFVPAIHNLGRILKDQGKVAEAVEQWQKVLQFDPDHAAAHANIGLVMVQQGEYKQAIEHLNKSLQAKPNSMNLYAVGHVYQRLGKYNMAIQNYTEAVRLEPDFPHAHFDLAVACSEIGDHEMAVQHYKEVLRIQPDYPGVLNNIGMELKEQGKINQAIEMWKKALDIHPGGYGVHFNIGLAAAEQGDYDEAVERYKKALLADPNWPEVHLNLGWAYAQLGRYGLAIGHYYRLLQLNPDRVDTLRRLAWILATTEDEKFIDPPGAISLAQKACRLTDYREPLLLDTLAAAYAAAGKFSQAVTTAENALRLAQSLQQIELAEKIKERRRLYKANQRCIE